MLTKLGRTLTAQDAGTTESWMDQLHNSCIANQIVQGCRFHSSGHGCLSVELEDGQLTFMETAFMVFRDVLYDSTSCSKMFVMVGHSSPSCCTSLWNSKGSNFPARSFTSFPLIPRLNNCFVFFTSSLIASLSERDNIPPRRLSDFAISLYNSISSSCLAIVVLAAASYLHM